MNKTIEAFLLLIVVLAFGNLWRLLIIIPEEFGLRTLFIFTFFFWLVYFIYRGFRKLREGQVAQLCFLICLCLFTMFSGFQLMVSMK